MALAEGVGSKWTVGIDGVGYMLSTLDQESPFEYRSFSQQAVPLRVPRIDTSVEPGESSLGDLWVRSQHDWSGGMDQRVFDGENSDRLSSFEIIGYDPFLEGGKISSSEGVEQWTDIPGGNGNNVLKAHGDLLYLMDHSTTFRRANSDLTVESITITARTNIASQPSYRNAIWDDNNAYYSTANGIYKVYLGDAFGAWSETEVLVNDLTHVNTMNFGKGRLIACKNNNIHIIDDLTSTTSGATAHYTHIDDGWVWSDIEDMGQGIYLSGYSDATSRLYAMSFDTSDASAGLTIGIPKEVWRAPGNEKILCVEEYAGSGFLIGTTKGVRNVIIIDRDGNVVVGPLIKTIAEVHSIGINNGYAFFPLAAGESISYQLGDLGKMNLASFAYTNLVSSWTSLDAKITSMAFPSWANKEKSLPFFARSSNVLKPTSKRNLVGYFNTGEIRFGSLVPKEPRSLEVTLEPESVVIDSSLVTLTDPPVPDSMEKNTWLIKLALDTWSLDAGGQTIAMQGNSDSDFLWRIAVNDTRNLIFEFIDTTDTLRTFTSSAVIPDWDLDNRVWIRVSKTTSGVNLTCLDPGNSSKFPGFITTITEDFLGFEWIQLGFTANTDVIKESLYDTYPIKLLPDLTGITGTALYSFDYFTTSEVLPGYEDGIYGFRADRLTDDKGNLWVVTDESKIVGVSFSITYVMDDKTPQVLLGDSIGQARYQISFPEDLSFSTIKLAFLTLSTDVAKHSGGILDWRMSCEPIPTPRYNRYYVPIMLYDRMTLADNSVIDRPGYAYESLEDLETLFRNGTALDLQKPSGYHVPTESTRVRIEEMEFKSYAPPRGASGFGGIALLVLKEIAT